tara:strand:+ start:228 stop:389 length:162 start_codon:yes stop_codon:yes gene_type:complete
MRKKKSNQFTNYNILIKLVFMGLLLFSCEGWSVMGYALDKSQENKIDSTEINE